MIRHLTEKEFIEMFSEAFYLDIIKKTFALISETQEFKNDLPYSHHLMTFPVRDNQRKEDWVLIVEANCHKPKDKKGVVDFGIIKLSLTDEEMPDHLLDRYNAIQEVKKEIKAEETKNKTDETT